MTETTAETATTPAVPDEIRGSLALALDVDDLVEANRLARELRPWFGVAKVGLELYSAVGPDAILSMADQGFDPELRIGRRRTEIVLRACPFQEVAVSEPRTVCTLHLGIAEGLAAAGVDVAVDELVVKDPRRACCRLRLRVDAPS